MSMKLIRLIIVQIIFIIVCFAQACGKPIGKYSILFQDLPNMTRSEFRNAYNNLGDDEVLYARIIDENVVRYEYMAHCEMGTYYLRSNADIDYFEIGFISEKKIYMCQRFFMDGSKRSDSQMGEWFKKHIKHPENDLTIDRFLSTVFMLNIKKDPSSARGFLFAK